MPVAPVPLPVIDLGPFLNNFRPQNANGARENRDGGESEQAAVDLARTNQEPPVEDGDDNTHNSNDQDYNSNGERLEKDNAAASLPSSCADDESKSGGATRTDNLAEARPTELDQLKTLADDQKREKKAETVTQLNVVEERESEMNGQKATKTTEDESGQKRKRQQSSDGGHADKNTKKMRAQTLSNKVLCNANAQAPASCAPPLPSHGQAPTVPGYFLVPGYVPHMRLLPGYVLGMHPSQPILPSQWPPPVPFLQLLPRYFPGMLPSQPFPFMLPPQTPAPVVPFGKLGDKDVPIGVGGHIRSHLGHKNYMKKVEHLCKAYDQAKKPSVRREIHESVRREIRDRVVKSIQKSGGFFYVKPEANPHDNKSFMKLDYDVYWQREVIDEKVQQTFHYLLERRKESVKTTPASVSK